MTELVTGISCSTRDVGIAVLNRGHLMHYHLKQFNERWSEGKPQRIMEHLIKQAFNGTSRVALVLPAPRDSTRELQLVFDCIMRYCTQTGIELTSFQQEVIHARWCNVKAKKKMLMHKLVERYPELNYCFERELRNQQPFYIKLFEALAAAMLLERGDAPLFSAEI